MKKLLIIIALICGVLFAAPHSFLPVSYTQPDGSVIEIFASGDEFHNWLHDKDNYTIIQDHEGWYTYARQDGENVAPSSYRVGHTNAHKMALNPGVNLSAAKIQERYQRMAAMRDYTNSRAPHHGLLNNLVVFIRFADDPEFSQTLPYYDTMFNDNNAGANSMKNYFLAASYQQLTVDSYFYPEAVNNVIVCYVDSQPRNYYRKLSPSNPIGYDESDFWERTDREHTLLANASNFVANSIPLTLNLDGDNDGYVDNVCFIIQGNTDGWAELLWPHRWILYSVDAFINGAQVWDFNFQLENSLSSSGASVLSHEMFHSLGAPDLYRYNDSTIDPIGRWDIMCANSTPPQHMGAWMKHRYGQWLDAPPLITESGTYTLQPLASSSTNNAYRIPSWNNNQYYVVEYRKGDGVYDDNLPGQGLLVYRLYTQAEGNADGPPDELYLYRPGGTNTTTNGNLNQAAFSQNSGRTMINENTTPSGFLNDNGAGGLNLFNIGLADDTISFDVRISDLQISRPQGGDNWFSGSWQTIQWKRKSSAGTVKLEYSVNGGDSWFLIADTVHNSGNYVWTNVPHLDSDDCFIRITLNTNGHSDTNHLPFSIYSAINPPELLLPENNATLQPTNPHLSWQAVTIANAYYLEFADNPYFDPCLIQLEDHAYTQYRLYRLTPHSTYYWRVASITDVGISPFSDTWSFSTGDVSEAPAVPVLLYPQNLEANLPRNPEFAWQAADLAESYRLQIATHAYFSEPVVDMQNITDTNAISPLLAANTLYFWRVAAVNSYASSNYSVVRRFTTGESVDNQDEMSPPVQNRLWQNNPNPFSSSTEIKFSLKDANENLSLKIYNIKGQLLKSYHWGAAKAGEYKLSWDGTDASGKAVNSGIYLYRLEADSFSETRKLLLHR